MTTSSSPQAAISFPLIKRRPAGRGRSFTLRLRPFFMLLAYCELLYNVLISDYLTFDCFSYSIILRQKLLAVFRGAGARTGSLFFMQWCVMQGIT